MSFCTQFMLNKRCTTEALPDNSILYLLTIFHTIVNILEHTLDIYQLSWQCCSIYQKMTSWVIFFVPRALRAGTQWRSTTWTLSLCIHSQQLPEAASLKVTKLGTERYQIVSLSTNAANQVELRIKSPGLMSKMLPDDFIGLQRGNRKREQKPHGHSLGGSLWSWASPGEERHLVHFSEMWQG